MQSEDVTVALNFLMGRGVVDNNEDVRSKMLDAGSYPTPGNMKCDTIVSQQSCERWPLPACPMFYVQSEIPRHVT